MLSNALSGFGDPEREANLQRAFRLVGEFMHDWSMLEFRVNQSIKRILKLSAAQAAIVNANIPFRNKIAIIGSAASTFVNESPDWHKAARTTLTKIGDLYQDRCTVAHDGFGGDPKGVRFYVTKARTKLVLPEVIWSEEDFAAKGSACFRLSQELENIVDPIAGTRGPMKTSLIEALLAAPTPAPPMQELGGLLGLRTPESPHSNPASPEIAPRKPKAPRKKPKG